MRTRMYGGVRGRKTKVGGKSTFVFLLLDYFLKALRITQQYQQGVCMKLNEVQQTPLLS